MAWYKHPTAATISTNSGATNLTNLQAAWAIWELDANVHWQIASYNSVAPAYLILKRKDGSAGRILFTSGTTPASNYCGYSETANATALYMCHDFLATTDTLAYGNYAVNGAALFQPNSEFRGRLRTLPNGQGTYTMKLYCDAANDIVFMWGAGGTLGGFAWGKMLKADNGTTPQCYTVIGLASPSAGSGALLTVTMSSSLSYSSNLASNPTLWAYDPAANEGTTTAVHLIANVLSSSSGIWNPGGYTNNQNQLALSNGVRRFMPAIFAAQAQSAMARPSYNVLTSRYWGYGPTAVLDTVWTDNASVVRGYYLGHTAVASTDGSMLSVLNNSF